MGDVLVTRDSSRPRDGTGRVGYGTGLRDGQSPNNPYLLRTPVDVADTDFAAWQKEIAEMCALARQLATEAGLRYHRAKLWELDGEQMRLDDAIRYHELKLKGLEDA